MDMKSRLKDCTVFENDSQFDRVKQSLSRKQNFKSHLILNSSLVFTHTSKKEGIRVGTG